jgi:hypothetical protein
MKEILLYPSEISYVCRVEACEWTCSRLWNRLNVNSYEAGVDHLWNVTNNRPQYKLKSALRWENRGTWPVEMITHPTHDINTCQHSGNKWRPIGTNPDVRVVVVTDGRKKKKGRLKMSLMFNRLHPIWNSISMFIFHTSFFPHFYSWTQWWRLEE